MDQDIFDYFWFVQATPRERRECRKWIVKGIPYQGNPWNMAGEDGRPLDLITALRLLEDMPPEERLPMDDACDDLPF